MTKIVKILDAAEIALAQQRAQQVVESVKTQVPKDNFVFYAGFEGTNNNRDNLALSGDKQSTAVGVLEQSVKQGNLNNPNVVTRYYPGLGTEGSVPGSSVLPGAVTAEALRIAEDAYNEFRKEAQAWLKSNPGGQISVADVSFSRGIAPSTAFKQLVFQRGLRDENGRELIAPGQVQFAPSLAIDPVAMGVYGNMILPPGAAEHLTVVRAANEQRGPYKAVDFGGE